MRDERRRVARRECRIHIDNCCGVGAHNAAHNDGGRAGGRGGTRKNSGRERGIERRYGCGGQCARRDEARIDAAEHLADRHDRRNRKRRAVGRSRACGGHARRGAHVADPCSGRAEGNEAAGRRPGKGRGGGGVRRCGDEEARVAGKADAEAELVCVGAVRLGRREEGLLPLPRPGPHAHADEGVHRAGVGKRQARVAERADSEQPRARIAGRADGDAVGPASGGAGARGAPHGQARAKAVAGPRVGRDEAHARVPRDGRDGDAVLVHNLAAHGVEQGRLRGHKDRDGAAVREAPEVVAGRAHGRHEAVAAQGHHPAEADAGAPAGVRRDGQQLVRGPARVPCARSSRGGSGCGRRRGRRRGSGCSKGRCARKDEGLVGRLPRHARRANQHYTAVVRDAHAAVVAAKALIRVGRRRGEHGVECPVARRSLGGAAEHVALAAIGRVHGGHGVGVDHVGSRSAGDDNGAVGADGDRGAEKVSGRRVRRREHGHLHEGR